MSWQKFWIVPGLTPHDSEVKRLPYADELVLLSATAEGLQHGRAPPEQYSEEWALTVNLHKTRVMGNTYGGELPEHSTSYTRKGFEISASVWLWRSWLRGPFMSLNHGLANQNYQFKHGWNCIMQSSVKLVVKFGDQYHSLKTGIKEKKNKSKLSVNRGTSDNGCRAELGLYFLNTETPQSLIL